MKVIGLMSGTSMDGVDVAFLETDGDEQVVTGPYASVPYPATPRVASDRLARGSAGGGATARLAYRSVAALASNVTGFVTSVVRSRNVAICVPCISTSSRCSVVSTV